jgi:hypothetical protein
VQRERELFRGPGRARQDGHPRLRGRSIRPHLRDRRRHRPPDAELHYPEVGDAIAARIELFGHRDVRIVGTSHRQDVLQKIAGNALGRGEHVAFTALIVPEPENPHDPNAIAVVAQGLGPIGYFGRRDAVRYRALAQELIRREAVGVCEAFLTGGWDDEASIGVKLEIEGPEDTAQQVRAHRP